MPRIRLDEGLSLHCAVDDYLWPWEQPTPVMMLHGFARNATFWNRWVPAIADSRRIYRPDLLGCGASDMPAASCHFTPDQIAAEVLTVLDALSLPRVHWVGESSGGLVGLLLAASHPRRIASLVLCNTPTRISNEIRGYTRSTKTARRRRSALTAPANGAAARSAIGSISTMQVPNCANGASPRWTRPGPTSPRHCTNVSRASMSCRCCPRSKRRSCCSAATKAGSPPNNKRSSRKPCRMAGSNCSRLWSRGQSAAARTLRPRRPRFLA